MKKISIIIPIYNSEKYLSQCLDSIIESKKNNIEIILIDDGSSDSSYKICNIYAKKDKRIKIFHIKNSGVSNARNLGIKKASGDYLLFVDADDVLDKNWDSILKYIKKEDIYYFTNKINPNISKIDLLKYIIGFNNKKICIAAPFSKLFSRKFLINNKIKFNKQIINGEDLLFNVNAIINCISFSLINKSFYNYRIIEGSATKRYDERIVQSDICFHNNLKSLLDKGMLDNNLIKELCLYCKQNAIVLILQRITYVKKYKYAKKLFNFWKKSPYKDIINKNLYEQKNKLQKFLFFLLKNHKYYLIYYFLKFKKKINMINKSQNYFIKI